MEDLKLLKRTLWGTLMSLMLGHDNGHKEMKDRGFASDNTLKKDRGLNVRRRLKDEI